jgi:UDP-glucose 4-epimerase
MSMDQLVSSRELASSPSLSSVSSLDSPQPINTPNTQVSVLFDEDVVEDPLDIAGDENTYILVTGGLGYIGSHTTLELLKAGYSVLVIDDLSNSYRSVLERIRTLAHDFHKLQGSRMPALRFHKMDYRSPSMMSILSNYSSFSTKDGISPEDGGHSSTFLSRESRITGVIHFAAFKSVEESIASPLSYYSNNVCGLVNFLGLLQEFGIKNFVFSSSATVYGSMANSGVPLQEEHAVHFEERRIGQNGEENIVLPGVLGLTSPYGRSKFMCEQILADLAKSDSSWKITALRYFNPVR